MSVLRLARALTWTTSAAAVALTAHTAWNLQHLRRPTRGWPQDAEPVIEPVSVLLPLREEAHRVEPALRALLRALDHSDGAELVALDDESRDGTADVVRRVCAGDPRVRLLPGTHPPPGWLGKPWACAQLAAAARPASRVLVFVDADVVLAPEAIVATVHQLRESGLQLVSPYPRQLALSPTERLVQPLLQWSWLTALPLRRAETSARPSLAAANGQLLAVDRAVYERAGGHAAVRADVLDDLALLRAVKAVGGRGGVTDGTHLATCRMYDGWAELRQGYTKSLWAAFGSPAGALGATGCLALVYVWPFGAALAGSRVGAVGYAAGVLGRVLAGRRTGARTWPDALAHPASVVTLAVLATQSVLGHRGRKLTWKGRAIP